MIAQRLVADEDGKVRTPKVWKSRDGERPELEPFVIDSVTFNQDTPDPVRVGVHELTAPVTEQPSAERDDRRDEVVRMRRKGVGFREIARRTGVALTTVQRWCRKVADDPA